jgi:uncharacterized membrane protein YuzA (DUF378 family)
LRRNSEAAILAAMAGVSLVVSGWSGARTVDRLFALLEEIFGDRPLLIVLAYVFIGLASLGGFAVLITSYLFWRDRVRFGRVLILIGSGAGLFTLLLFILVNLRREEFSPALSVIPAVVGITLGIVARFWAHPKPIL